MSLTLAQFENDILSHSNNYVVYRVKRRYRRFLINWAYERFGATFPPKFVVGESLIDTSYSDFCFNQGSVQEQMNTIPIDYMNVSFNWIELLKYTFSK